MNRAITETPDGVLIEAEPALFIPEADLQRADAIDTATGGATCEQCGNEYQPRNSGKPQKFCSVECRRAADAERKANAPTREQRATASDAVPATMPPAEVESAPAAKSEPWQGRIDRQYAIQVFGVENCGSTDVHIEQEREHGDGVDLVAVSACNAVRLARMIMWAAGFKAIGIYVITKYGNEDVEDGQEADQFVWRE